MIDAIRSEWIKVTTVTSTWVLAIVGAAFPLVVSLLTAAFDDDADIGFTGSDLGGLVAGTTLVSALIFGVVAILGITSEFSHLTIRPTFAALPDRWRALVAKPIVLVTISAVLTVLIVVLAWTFGSALAAGDQALADGDALASLVGVVCLSIGLTLLGYALGMIVRNTAAAICVLLLWPLIAEGLIAGLLGAVGLEGVQRWMPYAAGIAMVFNDADGATLGRVGGGAYFFAWISALLALGLWSTHRRDA